MHLLLASCIPSKPPSFVLAAWLPQAVLAVLDKILLLLHPPSSFRIIDVPGVLLARGMEDGAVHEMWAHGTPKLLET